MNPELKTEWVAALRSGNYEQGFGWLTKPTGVQRRHCCLGVLAEVGCRRGEVVATQLGTHENNPLFYNVVHGDVGSSMVFGDGMRKWAGLDGPQCADLMKMNDDEDDSFEQIAQWIEENL